MGSSASENTLIGFFARVSYAYDNRYNLLVSVRREGSSKLEITISGVRSFCFIRMDYQ